MPCQRWRIVTLRPDGSPGPFYYGHTVVNLKWWCSMLDKGWTSYVVEHITP